MNNRYQSVCYNWSEVTERLKKDKQTLARFMRFSASLYKMEFPDAALVFYHDPNATKVAELATWNRLGRFVNKGARSIAVFGDGDRCRHLFDISQTNGKPVPNGWRLTEDVANEFVDVINENYGKDCRDIHEALAAVAVDNIKAHSSEMQYTIEQMNLPQKDVAEYQRSVVSAVRFVIANRCEQNGGMLLSGNINLNAADYFNAFAGIEIPTNMEPVFPTEIVEETVPPEETPEIDLSEPTEEEIQTVVDNQPEDDMVIINNEPVVTTDLPAITDEAVIFGILSFGIVCSVSQNSHTA